MRVGLCHNGFVVGVNDLPRVPRRTAFYVAAFGVVDFDVCARTCSRNLRRSFNNAFGNGFSAAHHDDVRTVCVFHMQPQIAASRNAESQLFVLQIVLARIDGEPLDFVFVGRFGFFLAHLAF